VQKKVTREVLFWYDQVCYPKFYYSIKIIGLHKLNYIDFNKHDFIPVNKPRLPKHSTLLKYLSLIDENKIYSNFGPLEVDLRRRYAELFRVGRDQIVLVNNGTQGLISSALTSGYSKVCIPSFSCATIGSLILQTRMEHKFVDIDLDNWTLNVEDNYSKYLNLFVLPFGSSINNLNILSQPNVLIDAEASIFNLDLNGIKMNANLVIMVSLHATKPLGGVEGGILICGSSEKASELREFITFGFSGHKTINRSGSNMKMSEYSAAVCHSTLDFIEITRKKWHDLNLIRNKINDVIGINPNFLNPNDITPYWIIQLKDSDERLDLINKLNKNKIEFRLWWGRGPYKEKAFEDNSKQTFKNAEYVADRYLGLPFFEDINQSELSRIIEVLSN
jgi:dTDP-4-amino-4,6-dideoxygalactose transaminase